MLHQQSWQQQLMIIAAVFFAKSTAAFAAAIVAAVIIAAPISEAPIVAAVFRNRYSNDPSGRNCCRSLQLGTIAPKLSNMTHGT